MATGPGMTAAANAHAALIRQHGVSLRLPSGAIASGLVEEVTDKLRKHVVISSALVTDLIHFNRTSVLSEQFRAGHIITRPDTNTSYRVEKVDDDPSMVCIRVQCKGSKGMPGA